MGFGGKASTGRVGEASGSPASPATGVSPAGPPGLRASRGDQRQQRRTEAQEECHENALYASLIGIVALLMVVPLEAGGIKRGYPAWDQQINDPKRFIALAAFGAAAVLDLETGLVWEQSPETAPNPTIPQTWLNAQSSCQGSPNFP